MIIFWVQNLGPKPRFGSKTPLTCGKSFGPTEEVDLVKINISKNELDVCTKR